MSAQEAGSNERKAAFRQLHMDAHFLLIALAHVFTALDVAAEVLGNDELVAIRRDFQARAPWVKDVRDVLEHLDAYVVGDGRLYGTKYPDDRRLPQRAAPMLVFDPLAGTHAPVVMLGSHRLPLRAAADTGSKLGRLIADAWEERFGTNDSGVPWGRST